jgi:hypothetical protein
MVNTLYDKLNIVHLLVAKLKISVKMHGEHNVKLTANTFKLRHIFLSPLCSIYIYIYIYIYMYWAPQMERWAHNKHIIYK